MFSKTKKYEIKHVIHAVVTNLKTEKIDTEIKDEDYDFFLEVFDIWYRAAVNGVYVSKKDFENVPDNPKIYKEQSLMMIKVALLMEYKWSPYFLAFSSTFKVVWQEFRDFVSV